jgi:lipopolysaccharide transport system ATP-binding protein
MLVRLGFAIATSVVPEILLMDEWLSAGDADFGKKAQAKIREVVDSSKILAIASHSRGTIERACNQVLWLESGRMKMLGEPKEVLDAYFG